MLLATSCAACLARCPLARCFVSTSDLRHSRSVPCLTANGVAVGGSSKAIERYLARELDLFGADSITACKIDSFLEHLRDLKDAWAKAKTDPVTKAAFLAEGLRTWLDKLEAYANVTGGAWLVGDKLTIADVYMFHTATDAFAGEEVGDAFTAQPKLAAAVAAVGAHSAIAEYLSKRPVTAF